MKKLKFVIAAMVIAVGVVGVFAFDTADEKEAVKKMVVQVEHGILNDDAANNRWQITQNEATITHNCPGTDTKPCTAIFEELDMYEENGLFYVDKPDASTANIGPYTE